MKQSSLLFFIVISIIYSQAYAGSLQQKSRQSADAVVKLDSFRCPAGGEPLVVYSTRFNNLQPISSKDTIQAIYVNANFSATPLHIEKPQQSSKKSKDHLIIKTRAPADTFVDFSVERKDGEAFTLNSVQFPVIQSTEDDDKQHQYVTLAYIRIDDDRVGPEREIPVRSYRFDEDYRLNVLKNIYKLTGSFTGWDQLTPWGTEWGKNKFDPMPFVFSSIQSDDDPTVYNGYGAWVCGSEQPQSNLMVSQQSVANRKFVVDKVQ
ncbi:MAG: hypothetical protein ACPGUD_01570 [Parashewanella sp.]